MILIDKLMLYLVMSFLADLVLRKLFATYKGNGNSCGKAFFVHCSWRAPSIFSKQLIT